MVKVHCIALHCFSPVLVSLAQAKSVLPKAGLHHGFFASCRRCSRGGQAAAAECRVQFKWILIVNIDNNNTTPSAPRYRLQSQTQINSPPPPKTTIFLFATCWFEMREFWGHQIEMSEVPKPSSGTLGTPGIGGAGAPLLSPITDIRQSSPADGVTGGGRWLSTGLATASHRRIP